ncbi:MAG: hypothetical protein K2F65_01735 [Eubacterium sp.]|nr:hypothetical protein [Eubacterium sp.]
MSKRKLFQLNPEYDWSKEAFIEFLNSPEWQASAKKMRREKQAKKNAKIRKKQIKRTKRQTAILTTAVIANKAFKDFMK